MQETEVLTKVTPEQTTLEHRKCIAKKLIGHYNNAKKRVVSHRPTPRFQNTIPINLSQHKLEKALVRKKCDQCTKVKLENRPCNMCTSVLHQLEIVSMNIIVGNCFLCFIIECNLLGGKMASF